MIMMVTFNSNNLEGDERAGRGEPHLWVDTSANHRRGRKTSLSSSLTMSLISPAYIGALISLQQKENQTP